MVRFAKWEEVDVQNSHTWPLTPKCHIGILIHHDKNMGFVDILYEGKNLRIRSSFVEKAGKRDFKPIEKRG